MRGKLWFLGGAAVGFVIGARAGRERYDQIVSATRRLWDHPTTQEAAGVMQEQANRLYAKGKETVGDKLRHSKLGEKFGHHEAERESAPYSDDDTLTGVTRPTPPGPTPNPPGASF